MESTPHHPQTVTIDVAGDSDGARRDEEASAAGDEARSSRSSRTPVGPQGREEDEDVEQSSSGSEIMKERRSSASDCSVEVDLGSGACGTKLHSSKSERDCRICHMSLHAGNQDSGVPIELGCSCKDDLASAHKHCAETWFKIKGNKICEVCGSLANNVVAGPTDAEMNESWSEAAAQGAPAGAAAASRVAETRRFWRGHRFLNFLLACMVFAFVISWLFHFNVPS